MVAGVHVKEASQQDVSITAINCGQSETDEIDVTKTAGKCVVKGENLHSIAKLVLRNAKDAKIEASVVVSGGNLNTATAQFDNASWKQLNGSYQFFWVDKSGSEEVTSTTISVIKTGSQTEPQ